MRGMVHYRSNALASLPFVSNEKLINDHKTELYRLHRWFESNGNISVVCLFSRPDCSSMVLKTRVSGVRCKVCGIISMVGIHDGRSLVRLLATNTCLVNR